MVPVVLPLLNLSLQSCLSASLYMNIMADVCVYRLVGVLSGPVVKRIWLLLRCVINRWQMSDRLLVGRGVAQLFRK